MLYSRGAAILGRWIMVLAGCGAVAAFTIGLLAPVRGRPLPGASWLLVLGAPLLLAGQGWGIAWLRIWNPAAGRVRSARTRWRNRTQAPLMPSLGPLSTRARVVVATTALFGWASALTAWPALGGGSPTSPTDACPYRLMNHGSYTCVTQSTYLNAGVAGQRFAAGILLFFFAGQTALAFAGLLSQRQVRQGPPPD
jgi:hypothetical protein